MPKGAANLDFLRAVVLTQHLCRRMHVEHIGSAHGLEKTMIQAGIRLAARFREKPDTVVAVAA